MLVGDSEVPIVLLQHWLSLGLKAVDHQHRTLHPGKLQHRALVSRCTAPSTLVSRSIRGTCTHMHSSRTHTRS